MASFYVSHKIHIGNVARSEFHNNVYSMCFINFFLFHLIQVICWDKSGSLPAAFRQFTLDPLATHSVANPAASPIVIPSCIPDSI